MHGNFKNKIPVIHMKHITLLALAYLTASHVIFAQIYTTPVGYATQKLLANKFNLVGLTLHNSPVVSGVFDQTSGVILTDSNASIVPVAGRTYILEITSGTIAGVIQAVTATNISSTTITTPDDLDLLGLNPGDSYSLRLAPTLEEIFGTTSMANGGNLYPSLSANTADNIWVGNGSGGFNKYFLHSASSTFRIAGTTTPAPNIPIIYADALYVEKRSASSTDKDLVTSGQIKLTPTNNTIFLGFNTLSVVSPVGLTLRTAGFENGMYQALSANTADNLWVPQADGSYVKYFRRSGQWRLVSAPTVDLPLATDPVLPSAVIIERRSSSPGISNVLIQVPVSYQTP